MWVVDGVNMSMTENDFGVALPTEFEGATFGATDTFKFTFKDSMNGETILEKTYTSSDVVQNKFSFVLSEADSEKFPVGTYLYSVDWYTAGVFNCCIVECGLLKVGDKV